MVYFGGLWCISVFTLTLQTETIRVVFMRDLPRVWVTKEVVFFTFLDFIFFLRFVLSLPFFAYLKCLFFVSMTLCVIIHNHSEHLHSNLRLNE